MSANNNHTPVPRNNSTHYLSDPVLLAWWLAPLVSVAAFVVGLLFFIIARFFRDRWCPGACKKYSATARPAENNDDDDDGEDDDNDAGEARCNNDNTNSNAGIQSHHSQLGINSRTKIAISTDDYLCYDESSVAGSKNNSRTHMSQVLHQEDQQQQQQRQRSSADQNSSSQSQLTNDAEGTSTNKKSRTSSTLQRSVTPGAAAAAGTALDEEMSNSSLGGASTGLMAAGGVDPASVSSHLSNLSIHDQLNTPASEKGKDTNNLKQ